MKALRRFTVRAHLPERLAALEQLSINLRWSWDKPTQDLFEAIDPTLWSQCGRDPVALLGAVSPARLDELALDGGFLDRLDGLAAELNDYLSRPLWYQQQQSNGTPMPNGIAYFSMEFGVAEVLPNYSGGLGILAGDHLKAASDLGLPLIAVGLYYRSGYFRQSLTADGWQHETYPALDPQGLPLRLLTDGAGAPALVELALPDSDRLRARIWVAQVGRVPLLLLDSDIPENDHEMRGVTDRLYGGDQEHRMQQEILAGIGGIRAIRAYTSIEGLPAPEVYHMNEGHAGFLGAERIRELVDAGLDFDTALTVVRSSTVFTTHTPVPAGIDRFPHARWCSGISPATPQTAPASPPVRCCCPACRSPESWRSVPKTIRRNSTWPTWACDLPSAPTVFRCCTARSAGPCSTNYGPVSTQTRCRSGRSPTAFMRAPGRRRNGCSWARNCSGRTRSATPASGYGSTRSTRVICGGSGHNCGPCWSKMSGRGCTALGWNVVRQRAN